MAETPPAPRPDVAWMQQTALLDTTLTRIVRYAQLMQAGLRKGEIDIAHADQLGRSVLTALREAAALTARAEIAAREAVA
jgi:hypothetical protein